MNRSPLVEATGPSLDAANQNRAALWEAALRQAHGNFAHAGKALGFSRQRGHTLAKRHGLLELAARLRAENGQSTTGRPRRNPVISAKKKQRQRVR